MSICQSVESSNYSCKSKKKYKYYIVESVRIQYNIDKYKIQNIMENVLSQQCNMKVYGYNKTNDFYWCKEVTNCICTLYVTIDICSYDFNKSFITITPNIGKEKDVQIFIQNFKNAMQLYQKTSFIYEYLERN